MKTGLLADLVLMMSSSPEDVATRAVELLLQRSTAARSAVDRLLVEWRGQPGPSVGRWVSQVAGQDNGRTDLEGYATGDQALAIFENKFWAGLTDNQPGTYLRRLPESGGVLAFIAPASRVLLLAHELGLRLPSSSGSAAFTTSGQSHVAHLPDGKAVVVTSWTVLLAAMGNAMDAAGETENRADLGQLQSLVDRMDS